MTFKKIKSKLGSFIKSRDPIIALVTFFTMLIWFAGILATQGFFLVALGILVAVTKVLGKLLKKKK